MTVFRQSLDPVIVWPNAMSRNRAKWHATRSVFLGLALPMDACPAHRKLWLSDAADEGSALPTHPADVSFKFFLVYWSVAPAICNISFSIEIESSLHS